LKILLLIRLRLLAKLRRGNTRSAARSDDAELVLSHFLPVSPLRGSRS
jgi:hypothetical protein